MMISFLLTASVTWSSLTLKYCDDLSGVAIVGVAFDVRSNTFLYCEKHRVDMEAKKAKVEYLDKNKKIFATKSIHYRDGLFRPDIVQVDSRTDEYRSAKLVGDSFDLVYKKNARKKQKSKRFKKNSIDVIDAGFDHYVRANWQYLLENSSTSVMFASVPHLQNLQLRVSARPTGQCAKPQMDIKAQCFWIDIDNALLRFLTPRLKLTYGKDKYLYVFEGLVNIRSGKGKTLSARIFYDYQTDMITP